MARGGSRPGAGRPKKEAGKAPSVRNRADADRPRPSLDGQTPLEYMLSVMNNPEEDGLRRDKMAMAAAPYVHARAADVAPGKKEQKQAAAEEATKGRFAPRQGPRLAVKND
jgi:hypothetical protein